MPAKIISLLFLWIGIQPVQAQVKNLVFEGAGIRGIAYAGVVKELENRKMLLQVEKVAGTSAGAVVALMIALNYTSEEIQNVLGSTDFAKFNDGKYFFPGGINRLNKYFGWYRGQRLAHWLHKIIEVKTGDGNTTFLKLNQTGYKQLFITGTNLNLQKLVVFSAATYPNMKVKDALRISVSIPLYFEAVFIDTSGQIRNRPERKKAEYVMVDGGFLANYPIHIFDEKGIANSQTLGFRIDSDLQIQHDSLQNGLAPVPVKNLKEYMIAFYTMILESLNRQPLTSDDWKRTVSISDSGIGPRSR